MKRITFHNKKIIPQQHDSSNFEKMYQISATCTHILKSKLCPCKFSVESPYSLHVFHIDYTIILCSMSVVIRLSARNTIIICMSQYITTLLLFLLWVGRGSPSTHFHLWKYDHFRGQKVTTDEDWNDDSYKWPMFALSHETISKSRV